MGLDRRFGLLGLAISTPNGIAVTLTVPMDDQPPASRIDGASMGKNCDEKPKLVI